MIYRTFEWVCDECHKHETITTFDTPSGWFQITKVQGGTIEFCSHDHYVQWVLKKPKSERNRWPHTGIKDLG